MDIFYINHIGERIDLDTDEIILQYQELYDYSWDVESKNERISRFCRKNATIPVTVGVTADTGEKYFDLLHRFFSITEKDVLSLKSGKLYLGNQYLSCFISGSIKEDAFMGILFQKKNLTIVTDHPFWIREHEHTFKKSDVKQTNNKRYAYRYSYRYANGLMNTAVINEHYADCNFKMVVYGPIADPLVYISGHPYLVNIILETGEYLEIDSAAETVTKVTVSGERINAFHNRSFEHSVFEPVHPGRQLIGWSGRFDFDITLYEERSEPKWESRAAV